MTEHEHISRRKQGTMNKNQQRQQKVWPDLGKSKMLELLYTE